MKMFNKLLAVVLSLIMLLSVVPVAVFADDTVPASAKGTGSDGTITLNLDADSLIDALKSEKSKETLVELLKDAIDRSESTAFTADELMLLVPVKDILSAVESNAPEAYRAIVDAAITSAGVAGPFDYSNYDELARKIGVRDLLAAVKANLSELASKQLFKTLAMRVAIDMVTTIDLIKIEGYTIVEDATKDVANNFSVNYEEAARAIKAITPSFTELANATDGKLLSFYMELEYSRKTDGADPLDVQDDEIITVKKKLTVEIVLKNGVEKFCKFAQKLADHIDVELNGTDLTVDLTMPYELTEALAWYLEDCPKGEYIKDEILGIPNMTGDELVAALENMTWDRILNLLKHIDVEELYNYIMTLSKVQILLEEVQDRLGLDYDLSKLENLDTILAEIADGTPRITVEMAEKICDKISERVKMDIVAYIGEGAVMIESSETVRTYLAKLKNAPYIGKYIAKYIDKINNVESYTELYKKYQGMPVAEAIAKLVERELNKDLMAFLNNNDSNAIYDRLIQEVEERSSTINYIFERCKDYMLAAADPNYVANSDWGKLIQSIIPDEIYAVADKSLANAYRGNGEFELIDKKFENVNLRDNAENILNQIFDITELNAEYVEMINKILPIEKLENLTFGVHVNVTFPGVSRAIFLDENDNETMTMFLPNGTHPARFYTSGAEFSFWVDQTGKFTPVITEDVTLSPVCGFITGGYLDIDDKGNWTITSTKENFAIVVNLTNTKADENVAKMIEELKKANSITFANIQGLKMTMDKTMLTYVIDNRDYFAVANTATTNNGAVASDDFKFTPAKAYNFSLTGAEGDIAFNGNTFKITIPYKNGLEKNDEQRTIVYNVVDGKLGEAFDVTVNKGASVVFNATHFSQYVVVNEYFYNTIYTGYTFNDADFDGTQDMWVPETATVTVRHHFTYKPGKRIVHIKYNDEFISLGDDIIMPSNKVDVIYTIELQNTIIVYNVFGTLFYEVDEANAWNAAKSAKLPAGYYALDEDIKWVKSGVENSIVYYVPAMKATTIKVNFEGANADEFTADDRSLAIPAIKAEDGMFKYWVVDGAALSIDALIAAAGNNETATFNATIESSAINVANTVAYTIKGVPHNNSVGEIASFNVKLANGQVLTAAPAGCTLSSMTVEADATVYTYTFPVTADIQGKDITYTVSVDEAGATQLVNGVATNDTETKVKGLKFDKFSGILSFANGSYQFALFTAEGKTANLIWLWILLALIVLIGAIVLIYKLYMNKKMKPSFLTRFATWAVTVFFNACVAIADLFLMVTQGTVKNGEVNYEAIGMNAPADVETAEGEDAVAAVEEVATEEVAVDEATEAVEEVTETAEEVAPEAVEEVTETAEEVAPEAVEEVTETAEEVAPEAVEEATETTEETAEATDEAQN